MQEILDFIRDAVAWLVEAIQNVASLIYAALLDGLASVIEAIPVPAFADNVTGWVAAIPSGVAYFAQAAQIEAGISIMLGAAVTRFLIRRMPFVG